MAEYEVGFHPRARKQLDRLETEAIQRIRNKLVDMVSNPWRDLGDYDVRKIRGVSNDIYRTRVGDYRVFFVVTSSRIGILHVDDREGAYSNIEHLESRATDFRE